MHDHPDLILLDMHLPGISGEEVLRRPQAEPATTDIPVKDLLAAGASGFLAKPFAAGELLAIIARHLG